MSTVIMAVLVALPVVPRELIALLQVKFCHVPQLSPTLIRSEVPIVGAVQRLFVLVAGLVLTTGALSAARGQESSQAQNSPGQGSGSSRELVLTHRRWVPPSNVADLRLLLEKYAKVSKRGPQAIAGFLQILDVLDAKTDAEFHARVRSLPVTIQTSPGRDADGREGLWKVYTHLSGRQIMRFIATPTADAGSSRLPSQSTQPSTHPDENTESPSPTEASRRAPATLPQLLATSMSDDCEYTDPWGEYSAGECATEEDADEAAAIGLSLEAEVAAAQSEGETEIDEYCGSLIIYETPEQEELCGGAMTAHPESESLGMTVWEDESATPLALPAASFSGASSCVDPGAPTPIGLRANVTLVSADCIGEAFGFITGVAGFFAGQLNFWDVVTSIGVKKVTKWAIGAAVGWYVAGAAAAVGATYVYLDCRLNG